MRIKPQGGVSFLARLDWGDLPSELVRARFSLNYPNKTPRGGKYFGQGWVQRGGGD